MPLMNQIKCNYHNVLHYGYSDLITKGIVYAASSGPYSVDSASIFLK